MNKKKAFLLSWYFPSFPGGAEKSILEELKKYKSNGFDVFVISFDERFKLGKFNISGICGYNYKLKYFISFSRYWTYLLNNNYILSLLSTNYDFNSKSDLILTQSIMAPIFSKFAIKNNLIYIYYLRDESNLNVFNNYWIGFKKYLKYLKDLIDLIPVYYYKKQNVLALKNSFLIVSNSKFIYNLLFNIFNLKSDIILPKIDLSNFKKIKLEESGQKYITFIGGNNAMKGYDIVLKIAKKLPDEKFLVVGNYSSKKMIGNITYLPWQKDILDVYGQTKLLLVPSRWNEAFGRVVVEANVLSIPVISSSRGGLVEANVGGLVIDDFENIDLWVENINILLN